MKIDNHDTSFDSFRARSKSVDGADMAAFLILFILAFNILFRINKLSVPANLGKGKIHSHYIGY